MIEWRSGPGPLQTGGGTTAAETEGPPWLPAAVGELLANLPVWLSNTLQAVAVLLVSYVVARLLVRVLGRRIARRFSRPSITRAVLRGVKAGVYLFALLTILGIYGYGLGDIALSVTVFTAVIGVILAPIVGSAISGVFLLADQPYEIGDMVELADTEKRGYVEDITLRYTKIFTLDNTFLVIPNGTMRERDVINYSAEDTRTRQALDVLVTYESDLERAREILEDAARKVDGIVEGGPSIRVGSARYPAGPRCYIERYGDHGVLLRLRYWVEEPYWLLRLRSQVQTNAWEAVQDADVEIAYPHQHQVFDETSGTMQVSLADRDGQGARLDGTDGGRRGPPTGGAGDGDEPRPPGRRPDARERESPTEADEER